MDSANIKNITGNVKARYGETEALFHVQSALQSLSWKIKIASYHSIEALCILDRLGRENSALDIADSSINARGVFDREFLAIEAHIIACAYNIHSLPDILAHALCYALNFDATMRSKELENISARNIEDKLHNPENLELHSLVKNLTGSSEFKYLSAFVNTTKHRSLVPSGYVGDLVTNTYNYNIFKFRHKGEECPEKGLKVFIDDDFSWIVKNLVKIVICLDTKLSS